MKRMRRALLAVGLAAAGMIGTIGSAGSASAAPEAVAAYNGVCGDGYTVIDSFDLSTLGTVYLTWNAATGKNCAVTVNGTGDTFDMGVVLALQDNTDIRSEDSGEFTFFAGPVYLAARGQCVTWWGWLGDAVDQRSGHCGSLV